MQDKQNIAQWIDSLKIAIIENNTSKTLELIQILPFDESLIRENKINDKEILEYLDIAKELISQVINKLEIQREETRQQLYKIKQTRKFLVE